LNFASPEEARRDAIRAFAEQFAATYACQPLELREGDGSLRCAYCDKPIVHRRQEAQ
jgi:hypothetical protein